MTIGLQGGAGGLAESSVVPAENAVPIPDEVPLETAAVVEPLSVAVHAVRRSALDPGDDVAVFGAGSIGLSVVQAALAAGARSVCVSEIEPALRTLATDLGATMAIDPRDDDPVKRLKRETDGGVDTAFEVAGVEETFRQSIRSTCKDGTTTIISIFDEPVAFNPTLLMMAERTVTGSFGYRAGPRSRFGEFAATLEYLRTGRLSAEPLITGRISLENVVAEGFERIAENAGDHVKILVEP